MTLRTRRRPSRAPRRRWIDRRYTGRPAGTDIIAEGVYANAIVLGGALTPIAGLDLALEGLVVEQSGVVVATNTAAEACAPATSR